MLYGGQENHTFRKKVAEDFTAFIVFIDEMAGAIETLAEK